MKNPIIPSVNYHLWKPCNMGCKFCFATYQSIPRSELPKGHLPMEQSIAVVEQLIDFGFQKITFAGGEPTLCSWLPILIETAKAGGMTTAIVTNGSRLTDDYLAVLEPYLDWVAISIDSLTERINQQSGRSQKSGSVMSETEYYSCIDRVRRHGFKLKINTVVHHWNWEEDISDFIRHAAPSRWKVFQALVIRGENDICADDFTVTNQQFAHYLRTHQHLDCMVPEDNDAMTSSYAMVNPAGRFYDNGTGAHTQSSPILEVGCAAAYGEMPYSQLKFAARGGQYRW